MATNHSSLRSCAPHAVTIEELCRRAGNRCPIRLHSSLQLNPLSVHLFVFSNQRRNRVKILFWDKSDWWLCAKRLESGTLAWPDSASRVIELSNEQLSLLLSGINLGQTQAPL
ncbi:MAG: transposase [Pedosphaera sp.]|nr:transposase [Pedosphaera sp.]